MSDSALVIGFSPVLHMYCQRAVQIHNLCRAGYDRMTGVCTVYVRQALYS